MDYEKLHSVLTIIGERVPPASQLTLVGGSALILLGSPRLTVDIELEHILNKALPLANKFDFHPEILSHLQDLKNLLK